MITGEIIKIDYHSGKEIKTVLRNAVLHKHQTDWWENVIKPFKEPVIPLFKLLQNTEEERRQVIFIKQVFWHQHLTTIAQKKLQANILSYENWYKKIK